MPTTSPTNASSTPLTHERTGGGASGAAFVAAISVIGLATAAFLMGVAIAKPGPVASETSYLVSGTVLAGLFDAMGTAAARNLVAVSGGVMVVGVGLLGRRLFHNDTVGIIAALLVALDPAFVVLGHLALPVIPPLAAAILGAALLAGPSEGWRWPGGLLLAAGAFLAPVLAVWAIPLTLIVLLRGNIYAAPKHLRRAIVQATAAPLAAAVVGLAWAGDTMACLVPGPLEHFTYLQTLNVGGLYLFHNPAIWFGGWAALIVLAGAGLTRVVTRFRLARLPGRVQLRLPEPLPPRHARALWLGLLAALAPTPWLWLPLIAIGLAAAVVELGRDAPGFGIIMAAAAVLFSGVYLVRVWALVSGDASAADVAELLPIVPWSSLISCGS